MGLEFDVIMDVRWDERERCFIARCEEYEHLSGTGATPYDAIDGLRRAITLWFKIFTPKI